jgi:methionyl-tRNA synthetase
MERWALHDAVAAAFTIVDASNEYIAETAPWTLAKWIRSQAMLSG